MMLSLRIWLWWKLDDLFCALADRCARRANALEQIEQAAVEREREVCDG